ncbi:unnamed protein product [Mytilus coruscus]|uniref:Uncharacterized protein n=1 Tax=Mytilus coruscus TaxID=42192 RepID=A0A6J8A021_MYTCO|nr:unnamed protein product [Mytilus coruscus]
MFQFFENPTREHEGVPAQPGQFPDLHLRLQQVDEAHPVHAHPTPDLSQQDKEHGQVSERGYKQKTSGKVYEHKEAKSGKKCPIRVTAESKMVNAEWQKFGKSIGKDLPKLTASLNRKLAVTTMREAGADRQIQTALAKHMAHNPETADRFYDKSRRTTDRHAALDSVQGQYKQAFQEKETNV